MATGPIDTLPRRLDAIADRLTRGVENLVRDVTEEIGRELVPATPVDTGYARGNWRPSINAPAAVPVSVLDPTGQATISRIAAVAAQYRAGATVYIVNLAPYIGKLNEGSSPQAAAGFVGRAVDAGFQAGLRRYADGVIRR